MSKLFIGFGQGLIPGYDAIVHKAKRDGFEILALDIETANYIKKLNYHVSFLEDWLNIEERVNVWRLGIKLEKEWFDELYGERKIINGFDIRSDHIAMAGFWYEIALQIFLEKAFLKNQIKTIRFNRFEGYGAALAQSESDTFGAYWENHINKNINVEIIRINKNFVFKARFIKQVVKSIVKTIYSTLVCRKIYRNTKPINRVLFALSKGELNYYSSIINNIIRNYKRVLDITVLVTNINEIEAVKFQKNLGVEVITGVPNFIWPCSPTPNLINKDINKSMDSVIMKAYTGSESHFKYFETIRWPELGEKKKSYQKKLIERGISVVIVTNGEDQAHQLIGEVATNGEIASISLPHGILAFTHRGLSSTKYYAVGNELAKILAVASGVPVERIVKLKNLDPLHEYPMDHIVTLPGKFNILVLLDPIQHSNRTRVYANPFIGYKEQILALHAIAKVASNHNYNIIIKTHPGWPEHDVIEFADPKLMQFVCPKETSLAHLTSAVDLVISVNYAAAALVAVAKAELPTILFWKAPLLNRLPEGVASLHRFKEMGELTSCDDVLVELIERVRICESYKSQLKSLSRCFKEKYLATDDYQTIEEFIFELANDSLC